MGGFRHAIGLEHRRAERRLEVVHHLRRKRGAARSDESQPLGASGRSRSRVGAREQQLV
jgi:hypothetical protein